MLNVYKFFNTELIILINLYIVVIIFHRQTLLNIHKSWGVHGTLETPFLCRGADKSLALKNQATGLKKCIYSTYSLLSSTDLWLRCSNFFNPSKKKSFDCDTNRKIGNRKSKGLFFKIMVCEAIGTAATPGLLCQPRLIVKMIVDKQMGCRLAGETEVLGGNLPQGHFCPSQNPTWPDPGLNSGSQRLTAWAMARPK
jgi:hypothetical protein